MSAQLKKISSLEYELTCTDHGRIQQGMVIVPALCPYPKCTPANDVYMVPEPVATSRYVDKVGEMQFDTTLLQHTFTRKRWKCVQCGAWGYAWWLVDGRTGQPRSLPIECIHECPLKKEKENAG